MEFRLFGQQEGQGALAFALAEDRPRTVEHGGAANLPGDAAGGVRFRAGEFAPVVDLS